MSKVKITCICIFCFIMAGIIALGGYTTYEEYRKNKTYNDVGNDVLNGVNEQLQEISETKELLESIINLPIIKQLMDTFLNLENFINNTYDAVIDWFKEFLTELFKWIKNGDGDFVWGGDGFGGGGGGARP